MTTPAATLKTKIRVPPGRERVVARPRLHDLLREGLARPLTLVSAPAGFGKTTLLATWLRETGARAKAAWLTLDDDDNDPLRFVQSLAEALRAAEPGLGQATLSLLGSLHPPRPRDLVALLLRDVEELSEPMRFVLEDYHVITNREVNALTTILVGRLPQQLRLIITCRAEPALPIARWRANEWLTELGPHDLRFMGTEIDAFLNETMGLDLDEDAIQELDDRTEGWIAGLQLCAVSLQGSGQRFGKLGAASAIESFDGRHRYVIDYLAAEVLRQQPDDVRSFLGNVAGLDRLCAPLCDAVTGRHDGKEMLARLERANLFLLRLDDHRQWYRFHQLFADFLRSEFESDGRLHVHARASTWLAEHGFTAEAIRHALLAHNVATAVALVRDDLDRQLCKGEFPTVLSWLDALPDETVRSHSDLSVYKAWLLYLRGRVDESETYAALGQATDDINIESIEVGALLAFQAFLAINRGTPQLAASLAARALNCLGKTESFFRACALSLLGTAQRFSGERNTAIATLHDAIHLSRRLGNQLITLDALGDLAPLMYAKGQLREAILLCQSAVDEHVDLRGRPLAPTGLVHVRLGSLYYETDNVEKAHDCLTTGIDLCHRLGMVSYTVLAHRALAKVEFVRGQPEAAQVTLATARYLADQSGSLRYRRLIDATAAELELRQGNVTAARHILGDILEWVDTTTELELLAYAHLLMAQERPRMADSVLSRIEATVRGESRIGSLIVVLVLRALCRQAVGDNPAALQKLAEALSYAASAGYRRVFLDQGAAILPLLAESHHVAPVFVDSLLEPAARPSAAAPAPRASDQKLTKKEIEILRLLNAGLPNKTIAKRLAISLGTTKWHMHQIFGKLDVGNRTAAVLKARALGLI
jgi:LuxR family maltose regulon positive regulatory protein